MPSPVKHITCHEYNLKKIKTVLLDTLFPQCYTYYDAARHEPPELADIRFDTQSGFNRS